MAFHAADLSLANKVTVVKDVFSPLCRVKPGAERRSISLALCPSA